MGILNRPIPASICRGMYVHSPYGFLEIEEAIKQANIRDNGVLLLYDVEGRLLRFNYEVKNAFSTVKFECVKKSQYIPEHHYRFHKMLNTPTYFSKSYGLSEDGRILQFRIMHKRDIIPSDNPEILPETVGGHATDKDLAYLHGTLYGGYEARNAYYIRELTNRAKEVFDIYDIGFFGQNSNRKWYFLKLPQKLKRYIQRKYDLFYYQYDTLKEFFEAFVVAKMCDKSAKYVIYFCGMTINAKPLMMGLLSMFGIRSYIKYLPRNNYLYLYDYDYVKLLKLFKINHVFSYEDAIPKPSAHNQRPKHFGSYLYNGKKVYYDLYLTQPNVKETFLRVNFTPVYVKYGI